MSANRSLSCVQGGEICCDSQQILSDVVGCRPFGLGMLMRRRDFVGLAGGAGVGWPLAAQAQQPAMPVVGFLNSRASGEDAHLLTAFREGMGQVGYAEGRNVAIEYRFAENQTAQLPSLPVYLVRHRVCVMAGHPCAAPPAKAATTT